ncbi:Beta-monoglucosyldiacylglycerol synthase [Pseudoruegeria aquimaris]|uniref:Beta-monoglucosyldiacylglycerol synthase n=1 Tax=Pseudoruegeria aquimaris TaxID=393663 RepID=A0A1Y5S8I6_9RHOB|nr:glycosyltransferase family 2 protein [Pseudoruegeria aquimaris]SLN34874.1 Beta-monoglucosyldiacylglycerol synthase [Pseudoruegeria aquimaris]
MPRSPLRLVPAATGTPETTPRPGSATARPMAPLSECLVEYGGVDPGDLARALALRQREEADTPEILLANGWISEDGLMLAMSRRWGCPEVDLDTEPPDPGLVRRLGGSFCLKNGCVPWRRLGNGIVLATSRPEQFAALRRSLPPSLGPVHMVLARQAAVRRAVAQAMGSALVASAEARVMQRESCRRWAQPAPLMRSVLAVFLTAALLYPAQALVALFLLACLSLVALTALKIAAAVAAPKPAPAPGATEVLAARAAPPPSIARLPIVSILVPLFKERRIAEHLLARLEALDYPRELLDVILVLEEDDFTTRATLSRIQLPPWVSIVPVPRGRVRTKPRAMNYALDFCRGSLIGIYDAEDAPAPGQIHAVVKRFHERGPEVACLQGILDFYNAERNWLARCFTIEYATWFRVILPGLCRLGLVIPLGGTTLFFRRAALEDLGGWDAHNVTEDADLGLRLARHGYRAETLTTVTREEANARALPWIKQRSRWIKGYAVTYAVHMRNPAALLRDLGPWRFLGVQVLFAGSLMQVWLAPLLWSCWLMFFGLPHPVSSLLPPALIWAAVGLFLAAEVSNITIGAVAVLRRGAGWLVKWVPTLHFYHPLGTFAAYKAAFELIRDPFYWDKTDHGDHGGAASPEAPSSRPA